MSDPGTRGMSEEFDFPRARVYVMGSNTWRDLDAYPPQDTEPRSLYLTSGGSANGFSGDGRLAWTVSPDAPPDRYTYDPRHPVPSGAASSIYSGMDRTSIQHRDDVLVYTSDALTEPLEIIGPVDVVLYAATGTEILLVDQTEDGPRVLSRYSTTPGPDSEFRGTSFIAGTGSPIVADTDRDGHQELYVPLLSLRMLTWRICGHRAILRQDARCCHNRAYQTPPDRHRAFGGRFCDLSPLADRHLPRSASE